MAARHERKYERTATPVFSKRYRLETDLSLHGVDDLAAVAATLNARPRKVLGWRTPNEVFEQVLYGIELKVRGQAAGSQWKLVRFETRACCCISQTHH